VVVDLRPVGVGRHAETIIKYQAIWANSKQPWAFSKSGKSNNEDYSYGGAFNTSGGKGGFVTVRNGVSGRVEKMISIIIVDLLQVWKR